MRHAAGLLFAMTIVWALDAALGQTSFWAHDLRYHHVPWRVWASSEWLSGRLPLWAEGVGTGFPLMADGQTGVFYFPDMVLFAVLPPRHAVNASLLLHTWWAGVGTWRLLSVLGRSHTAALFGAVGFAFCGFMASHGHYLGMHNALSWLPWLIAMVATGRHGASGLCAWMMLVAGHPQAAAMGLLLATAVAAARSSGQAHSVLSSIPFRFGLAMLTALIAASPQLLATLELAQLSVRSGMTSEAFFNMGSLPPQEILNGVFPYLFGFDRPGDVAQAYFQRGTGYWGAGVNHWEMAFYLGIPIAGFSVFSVFASRRDRLWVGIAACSLLLMLGDHTPLWPVLRHLPGMWGFRFPVRFSVIFTLAMVILASGGVDAVLRAEMSSLKRWGRQCVWIAAIWWVGIGGVNLALQDNSTQLRHALTEYFESKTAVAEHIDAGDEGAASNPAVELTPDWKAERVMTSLNTSTAMLSSRVWGPAVLVLLSGVFFMLAASGVVSSQMLGSILVILLYFDLFSFGSDYQVRYPQDRIASRPSALEVIEADGDGWRTTVVDRRVDPALDSELMSANLGLLYGQRDVVVPSPLRLPRNERLLSMAGLDVGLAGRHNVDQLVANPGIVDLLGLRWLLTVHTIDDPKYTLMIEDPVRL